MSSSAPSHHSDHFLCFLACQEFGLVPMFLLNIPPNRPECGATVCSVEMNIISVFGLWWILCSRMKKSRETQLGLFSHIKTRIFIDHSFHVRRWEWTDTTGRVWTPTDYYLFLKRRTWDVCNENIPSPCTTVNVWLLNSWQSLVLLGARSGMRGHGGAYAFRFFNFVVNVSYFVQLQSWSLKEENHDVKTGDDEGELKSRNCPKINCLCAELFLLKNKHKNTVFPFKTVFWII